MTKNASMIMLMLSVELLFTGVAHAGSVMREGLVAHFPFNRNINDESGNSNHGWYEGNQAQPALSVDRFGTLDRACQFKGLDDQMVIEHDSTLTPQTMTLSAWIKGGDNLTGWARIVDKFAHSTKTGYALSRNNNNDTIQFELYDTSGVQHVSTTTSTIGANQWRHVAATFDGSTMKMYYDGNLEDTLFTGPTSINHSSKNLTVGNGFDGFGSWPFAGVIDDIRVYNRPLAENEIRTLYERENLGKNTFQFAEGTLYIPGVVVDGGNEYEVELQQEGSDFLFRLKSAYIKPPAEAGEY